MPKKKSSKKLEGINILICIDNKGFEKELTISKPYTALVFRRNGEDILVTIKANDRVEREYKFNLFRHKRNGARK